MPRLITWLTVSLLLLLAQPLISQSTVGTQFWLGYQENLNLAFNNTPVFTISVVADQPTNGTVTVPATGLSLNFSVPAGVTEVELFSAILYSAGSDMIDNKGLRITTDAPVQLFAHHYRIYFCESSLLLPEPELGTEYLITTPMDVVNNGQPNSFVVVATQDNTTVQITPTAITLGLFPADIPITITLNEGENYQVQSFGDLSGSSVRSISGQRIAVFAGAREANVNAYCFDAANSHVWDQQLPTSRFSDLFHFVPFFAMNGDGIKILALNDDTEVYFDCNLEVVLGAGESYFVARNVATVISSNGPISLWQYNDEGGCNTGNFGDPNGLNYLPAELGSTQFGWFATDRDIGGVGAPLYFNEHAATIIVPSSITASVTLDGIVLPPTDFTPFPGDPNFSYAQGVYGTGGHQISAPEPIQVYAYGYNEFDAYTMSLGYSVEAPINYQCGCDPGPFTHDIVADPIGCPGDTTSLTLTFDYPDVGAWYWVIEEDTIFDETFVEEYVFAAPGVYPVEVVILTTEGCVYSETILVEIIDCSVNCLLDSPDLEFAFPNPACVDSNLLLSLVISGNVSPVQSISWTETTSAQIFTGDSISTVFEAIGLYPFEVLLSLENGCEYLDTLVLNVVDCSPDCPAEAPTFNFSLADPTCTNIPINVMLGLSGNVSPVESIIWTPAAGGGVLSGASVFVTVENLGTYAYEVEVTLGNGCQYLESFNLEVADCPDPCLVNEPEFSFFDDELTCTDSLVQFGLIISGNDSPVSSVTWEAVSGGQQLQGTNQALTFSTAGNYQFNVTVLLENDCDYTLDYVISIEDCSIVDGCESDPPQLLATVLAERVCVDEPVGLSLDINNLNGRSIDSIVWNEPTAGVRLLGQNIPAISFSTEGNFQFGVSLFLTDGCLYEDSLIVEVVSCPDSTPVGCQYYWPSAFSPNLDGVNEVFKPAYSPDCQPTAYLLRIFDRWGDLVFETNNPNTGWNGISRGQAMNPAVFVYLATFTDPGGRLVQEAGELTLVR